MSETILLAVPDVARHRVDNDRLRQVAPDARFIITEDCEEMRAVREDVTIAAGLVPPELVLCMPKLRWYQQYGAGADWILDHPEVVHKEFVLTNASGVHGVPIAEHILALILAFGRSLHKSIRNQSARAWEKPPGESLFELPGKTMLLIGMGAIGAETARYAACLGVKVIGLRRNPDQGDPHVDRMVGPDQLHDVLPQADFVVVTVPLTAETRNLIGRAELRQMKSDAILVNIGRGGIVDEDALVEALAQNWIAGAGLDVFEEEPLPADSPLWAMENVIVTPHYAGATPRYIERFMEIFLDNLERFQHGEPLRNVVDVERGY